MMCAPCRADPSARRCALFKTTVSMRHVTFVSRNLRASSPRVTGERECFGIGVRGVSVSPEVSVAGERTVQTLPAVAQCQGQARVTDGECVLSFEESHYEP